MSKSEPSLHYLELSLNVNERKDISLVDSVLNPVNSESHSHATTHLYLPKTNV